MRRGTLLDIVDLRALIVAFAAVTVSCTSTSATDAPSGASTDSNPPATGTTTDSQSGGTRLDTSGGGSDSLETGEDSASTGPAMPPVQLCERIAISLVVDPDAPVFAPPAVSVYGKFFDHIVTTTGAEVRIRLGVGDRQPMLHFRLTPGVNAVDGPDLIWGRDFALFPEARDALGCFLEQADVFEGPGGDGDAMFEGLVGPLLDGFPASPPDVAAAMLIARADDEVNDAASRPGLASEAFLRLAVNDDRRRATAFAWGRDADKLETFTLSIGDTSAYYDRLTWSLSAALEDWRDNLVIACIEHDTPTPPRMPGGCEHVDILFVVDGSLSMNEEQAALRGINGMPPVFAEFTDALLDSLTDLQDFHVGVISSQPGDVVLHRHSDQPQASPTAALECAIPPDTNWIVGPNPDLQAQFACLAATLANTQETTAVNAAAALHHPANAGFLREDSVLFIVMLTDEDTQGLDVPRAEVHRQIMDAVGGSLARVVVLSIAGDPGTFESPKTVCQGPYGGASPGRRLTSIVRTFRDHGLTQDICGGDLAAVFDTALADVVDACLDFHPEG
ncbi:MAG: hypothetical protein JKY37_03555 [Nannocystaceae bacterium]|nr:hypothetical protein [Nannocystaceae bacterium]